MKARLFIVASSICLTLWMTASFFHDTSSYKLPDAYASGTVSQENQEVPFTPLPVDPSHIVTTSLRD